VWCVDDTNHVAHVGVLLLSTANEKALVSLFFKERKESFFNSFR
jgi:hypothetical protein